MTLPGNNRSLLGFLSALTLILCCGCNSAEVQILRDDLKRCQEDVARASERAPGTADGVAVKDGGAKAQESPEVATAAQGPRVQGQSDNSKDELAHAREEAKMLRNEVERLSAELNRAQSHPPETDETARAKVVSLQKQLDDERGLAQGLRQRLQKIESGILAYCRKHDAGCDRLREELGP